MRQYDDGIGLVLNNAREENISLYSNYQKYYIHYLPQAATAHITTLTFLRCECVICPCTSRSIMHEKGISQKIINLK